MKRRPPLSTSAPPLIERPLIGAHDHASQSIQRTPSRILFQPFWRLLYFSRMLMLFVFSHAPASASSPATPSAKRGLKNGSVVTVKRLDLEAISNDRSSG
jgi:hypothetical protein